MVDFAVEFFFESKLLKHIALTFQNSLLIEPFYFLNFFLALSKQLWLQLQVFPELL